jgi:hypothetical protein
MLFVNIKLIKLIEGNILLPGSDGWNKDYNFAAELLLP